MNHSNDLSELSQDIIKALLYYDIFDYPLTPTEIFKHLSVEDVNESDFQYELKRLTNDLLIFQLGHFFCLRNEPALADRRVKGNQLAKEYLQLAKRKAELIFRFPFVRAVMISGSLSKGYADTNSDIDFFIVTEPGRLWIARTLLVLYKRLFLFNSHKYFCVNYFVDSNHLHIDDKNIFTAVEVTTLIPLLGQVYYDRMMAENKWVNKFLPHFESKPTQKHISQKPAPRIWESMINLFLPEKIEELLMKMTQRRWERIYGATYASEDFQLAFRTTAHVSTNHPNNYQKKIIERHSDSIKNFFKLYRAA